MNILIFQNTNLYLKQQIYTAQYFAKGIYEVDWCSNFCTEVMRGSITGVIDDIQWFNSIVCAVQWAPFRYSKVAYEAPFNFVGLTSVRSLTHNHCRCLRFKFISFSKLLKANMSLDKKKKKLAIEHWAEKLILF